jgi:hypothetical protein
MADLDAIIDRYMVKPQQVTDALSNVTKSFDEKYECEDGFIAIYNEVAGKARYYFKGYEDKPLEATVTPEQRNYFVRSGYWRQT